MNQSHITMLQHTTHNAYMHGQHHAHHITTHGHTQHTPTHCTRMHTIHTLVRHSIIASYVTWWHHAWHHTTTHIKPGISYVMFNTSHINTCHTTHSWYCTSAQPHFTHEFDLPCILYIWPMHVCNVDAPHRYYKWLHHNHMCHQPQSTVKLQHMGTHITMWPHTHRANTYHNHTTPS